MATDSSFDVVSKIDQQELDNALNQARKEIGGRFDFKNSKTDITYDGKKVIAVISDDELKMKNVIDIIQSKAVKRGIDIKAFDFGTIEPAAQNTVRQTITLKTGIPKDKSKALMDAIKSLKLKVNAQYQDEQIRVSGKSRDELQKVIAHLKSMDYELPLQFVNYR
jgi:cyclic-di-GMP-binding protein